MTEQDVGGQLPCGARWDDLLEQVADGHGDQRSPHQVGCPHCQTALPKLRQLWAPVRALAAQKVVAPPGLVERVMDRVRELARDTWHAVLAGERGATRVAARVVATIARRAAGSVPGVRVALGRTTRPSDAAAVERDTDTHTAPGSAVGVIGDTAVIDLAIAAGYGLPLPALAQQVRSRVTEDVQTLAGLQAIQVNVTVDDIYA